MVFLERRARAKKKRVQRVWWTGAQEEWEWAEEVSKMGRGRFARK